VRLGMSLAGFPDRETDQPRCRELDGSDRAAAAEQLESQNHRREPALREAGATIPANRPLLESIGRRDSPNPDQASIFSAARNADCGISTLPNWRIRFLPSFCFSSSFRFREISPP
jgi:hypothetical protein